MWSINQNPLGERQGEKKPDSVGRQACADFKWNKIPGPSGRFWNFSSEPTRTGVFFIPRDIVQMVPKQDCLKENCQEIENQGNPLFHSHQRAFSLCPNLPIFVWNLPS